MDHLGSGPSVETALPLAVCHHRQGREGLGQSIFRETRFCPSHQARFYASFIHNSTDLAVWYLNQSKQEALWEADDCLQQELRAGSPMPKKRPKQKLAAHLPITEKGKNCPHVPVAPGSADTVQNGDPESLRKYFTQFEKHHAC